VPTEEPSSGEVLDGGEWYCTYQII
jgi:hypothetical protein